MIALRLLKTIYQREAVYKKYSMTHQYADTSLLSCIIIKNLNLYKETSFPKLKLTKSICLDNQSSAFEDKR